jgi:hypothetical protein
VTALIWIAVYAGVIGALVAAVIAGDVLGQRDARRAAAPVHHSHRRPGRPLLHRIPAQRTGRHDTTGDH